jgi:hypothetical protein
MGKHGKPWFSRPLDGHERVWEAHGAHARACLGASWALLGCSAGRFGHPLGHVGVSWPFLDTLMTHKGAPRQPNLEIRKTLCNYHGFRALGKEVRQAWRLIGARLVPFWVLSGCSGGRFGHSLSNLGLSSPVLGHIDVT